MTIQTVMRRSACAGLAVGAVALLFGSAQAYAGGGSSIWQGDDLGSPTDYGTATNWDLGFVPGPFEFIVFNGSASTFNVDLNGDHQVNGVTFSGITPYTIDGPTDTLSVGNLPGIDVLGAGTHTINSNVAFSDGLDHDWFINDGGNLIINGSLSHILGIPTGLVKSGDGTLTLNGVNTHSGGMTINAGVLEVNGDTGLGDPGGSVILNGNENFGSLPTLRVNGNSTTTRDFQAGQELSIIDVTDSYTINGTVSDAPGSSIDLVIKRGLGTLTLGGINTNTFFWSIGDGTLAISSDANLGDPLANAKLEFNGGSLKVTATHSTNRNFTGDDKPIVVDAGQSYTVNGVISSGQVIKLGPGTLTLTAANTYRSGTVIQAGVVSIADDEALGLTTGGIGPIIANSLSTPPGLGGGPFGVVTFDGGTLQVTATTVADPDREFILGLGNGIFDIATTNLDSYTIQNTVSGPGSLTKTGGGILALNGVNTYTGDTIVEAGTLTLETASLHNAADLILDGSVTVNLNFFGTDAIDELIIDNIAQQPGTYGGFGSGAEFTLGLFTGPGILEVPVPGLVGDLNGDGFVGIDDLNIVLANWNQTIPPGNPLADPSGDNFVGIDDLNTVLGNWNAGTPPPLEGTDGTVPEPGTAVLLGLGVVSLGARRRLVGKL